MLTPYTFSKYIVFTFMNSKFMKKSVDISAKFQIEQISIKALKGGEV